MSKVKDGQTVNVHYVGTLEDGTEFDSSRTRGEPLSFQVGAGQLIKGFDSAVKEMVMGETKSICVEPSEGYGERNSNAVQEVPLDRFPSDFEFKEGTTVYGKNQQGQQMMAKVEAIATDSVTLDFNHPLAGKTLNFEIELLDVT